MFLFKSGGGIVTSCFIYFYYARNENLKTALFVSFLSHRDLVVFLLPVYYLL